MTSAGSGGFVADPEASLTASRGLGTAADQLEAAGKALQSALAAEGECWGNDDSGKEFAKDYVPGAQGAGDAFGSLVEGLRGLQKNVEAGMESLMATEDGAEQTFTKGQ